jgi:hypothetical protein
MVTFNYPYSVASNKPMYSFGLLNRSNEPVGNRITNLFNSSYVTNNETPKIRTNSGTRFGTSITEPIVEPNVISPNNNRFMMANFPKPRRTLLRDSFNYQNPYKGDEMTGSFQNVGNAVTSRFGGGTVANPTYPNARYLNVKGKKSNNVDNNTGILNFKPKSNQENIETANKGILSQDKKEKSSFGGLLKNAFDKGVEFAQSDYGMDFFMGMDTGYSDTPKTLLDTIKPGYQYAEAKQQQEIENEINKLKAGKQNYREPVYRGLVIDKNGNEYGYFSSKGGMYAEINGAKVPNKDIKKVIGDYEIRNIGQQTFGLADFREMQTIESNLLNNERSLQSYERYLGLQSDTNQGIRRLADQYSTIFKTFFGEGLTEKELATKVANGELQRLIGASRKNIVGGGVMTEQDAIRIIDALGGNVDSLQSPQAVRRAISQMFKETYDEYKINLRQYNYNVDKEYGNSGYPRKKPIEFTKDQLKIFTSDITTGLGLLEYEDLTDNELLSINPTTLNDEDLDKYFNERNKRGLVAK